MKVRAALSIDAPALVEILVERHPDTRFAGIAGVDQPYARRLLAGAIHRHGHTNEGGCWVEVAEKAGRIEAFIFGALSRAYLVGDRLVAQDCLLVGRLGADPRALPLLLDGYVGWATGNPRVIETQLSHTDILPNSRRFAPVYTRRGFIPCGNIYRRAA